MKKFLKLATRLEIYKDALFQSSDSVAGRLDIFLRNVNLNLLPILQMLLRTRSVSGASTALGLSQPAVSDALSRLRDVLEDQLLVRVGSVMKLTPKAVELIEPLDKLCAEIESFLSKDKFDPKTARREFVIAASDIGAYLLARPIMMMLMEEAPFVTMQLVDVGYDLTDRMAARDIDFALLPKFALDNLAPTVLRFQSGVHTNLLALLRKGHPLTAKAILNNADLAQYRNIVFQPDRLLKDRNRMLYLTDGLKADVIARIGQALLLPRLIPGTDFIAVLPQQLAEDMVKSSPLATRPVTFGKKKMEIGFTWSPVFDSDPGHEWFRTTITRYIGKAQDEITADNA